MNMPSSNGYVQNMGAILKAPILDYSQIFPKIGHPSLITWLGTQVLFIFNFPFSSWNKSMSCDFWLTLLLISALSNIVRHLSYYLSVNYYVLQL